MLWLPDEIDFNDIEYLTTALQKIYYNSYGENNKSELLDVSNVDTQALEQLRCLIHHKQKSMY